MEDSDMPEQRSPAWLLGMIRGSDRASLRISDAERTEAADRLAAFYEEGRLDQDEYYQRLDQAMGAKTYRQLSAVFADLPQGQTADDPQRPGLAAGPHGQASSSHGLTRGRHLLLILGLMVAGVVAGEAWARIVGAWTWVGLAAVVIVLIIWRARRKS
jgi:hypothetical protein